MPPGRPLASGDDDHLNADRVVGPARPSVPGGESYSVLFGGQRDECVVDSTARYAETAQGGGQFPSVRDAQHERHGKPAVKQPSSVRGREPGIAGQPGEDGVGLGQSVTAERDFLTSPPAHDGRMIVV